MKNMRDRNKRVFSEIGKPKRKYTPRKPKNYWDILKKETRYYFCGNDGWQVRVYWENNKIQIGSYPELRGEPNRDLKLKMGLDKRVAQAVKTQQEYEDLWRRIDRENWDYIIENNLTGEQLVYWAYNTRTADEFDRLLRYN